MGSERLLLLSSSRTPGGAFLEHAREHIKGFLGPKLHEVLFIPYAAVNRDYDEMIGVVGPVFTKLGYKLTGLNRVPDPAAALAAAEAVAVSGGNTFRLLQLMQSKGLLKPLQERARAGMPYIGWSAGSNLACPTIRTTNDMPIVWPESCEALGLVPFQINPHYTELLPPEHHGETRDDRLKEFMRLNPGMPVVGLRECCILKLEAGRLSIHGTHRAKLFLDGQSRELGAGESLQFLLEGRAPAAASL